MVAPEKFDPSIELAENILAYLRSETADVEPVCAGIVYSDEHVSVLLQSRGDSYHLPTKRVTHSVAAAFGSLLLDDLHIPEQKIRQVLGVHEDEFDAPVAIEQEGRLKRYLPLIAIISGKPKVAHKNTDWYPYEEALLHIGSDNANNRILNLFTRTIVDWQLSQ